MPDDSFIAPITYFLEEGRANMDGCLDVAYRAAVQHNIERIIIFTAKGDGVRRAIENYQSRKEYSHIRLVAVTFPQGKEFTTPKHEVFNVDITAENRELFARVGVPIVKAHLPFDPIRPQFKEHGVLSQDLSLVGSALSIFGGSMSLCVQAVVLACDAGVAQMGEHVIAMTSDTAILARATCTRKLLSELVVREILCKPAILTIGRKEPPMRRTRSAEKPAEGKQHRVSELPPSKDLGTSDSEDTPRH